MATATKACGLALRQLAEQEHAGGEGAHGDHEPDQGAREASTPRTATSTTTVSRPASTDGAWLRAAWRQGRAGVGSLLAVRSVIGDRPLRVVSDGVRVRLVKVITAFGEAQTVSARRHRAGPWPSDAPRQDPPDGAGDDLEVEHGDQFTRYCRS